MLKTQGKVQFGKDAVLSGFLLVVHFGHQGISVHFVFVVATAAQSDWRRHQQTPWSISASEEKDTSIVFIFLTAVVLQIDDWQTITETHISVELQNEMWLLALHTVTSECQNTADTSWHSYHRSDALRENVAMFPALWSVGQHTYVHTEQRGQACTWREHCCIAELCVSVILSLLG